MKESDVEILEKKAVYRGYFRIDRYRLRHRLFAGGWSPELTREVFERGHVAAVLPYDAASDSVVLIEQFRIGAFAAEFAPWLTEIVAGVIEEGESPEDVARRETLEETGCAIQDLVPVHTYLVSPGGTSESVRLFCARVDARNAGGIHGNRSEHEDIRASAVPFADVMAKLEGGEIANGLALVALQWLAMNREELRRRWR